MLAEHGASHIRVFGSGGGTMTSWYGSRAIAGLEYWSRYVADRFPTSPKEPRL